MPGLFSYLSQCTSYFSSQVRVAFSISCNSKRLSNGRKMLLSGMRPTGGVCFLIVVFALVLLFKMQALRDYSVGLVSGPSQHLNVQSPKWESVFQKGIKFAVSRSGSQ